VKGEKGENGFQISYLRFQKKDCHGLQSRPRNDPDEIVAASHGVNSIAVPATAKQRTRRETAG